jgi:hypothetical protein
MVTVADSASLDLTKAMTLEAWVKPTTVGTSWRTVVVKEQPSQLAYALYAHNGNAPSGHVFTTRDVSVPGSSAVPLNTWTHLATTWDGQTARLFVNGTQVASTAVSGTMKTSNNPLRFGGNTVWPEWFKGSLDEIRIYNRALSAQEIQADRNKAI